MVYIYKITRREYGTKKEMWAEERPPRGHEQFSVVGRSGSRTSSEARLWWKSVEEKISGRERSVV